MALKLNSIAPYTKALSAAKTFIDAPKWQAEETDLAKRLHGRSPQERARLAVEDQDQRFKRAPDEYGRLSSLRWGRADNGIPFTTIEETAAARFRADTQIPDTTARALIGEMFQAAPTLTADDFASFRRTLEAAINKKPLLTQSLLVRRDLVERRGDAALKEIERTQSAITAFEEFLDEFFRQIAPARR